MNYFYNERVKIIKNDKRVIVIILHFKLVQMIQILFKFKYKV